MIFSEAVQLNSFRVQYVRCRPDIKNICFIIKSTISIRYLIAVVMSWGWRCFGGPYWCRQFQHTQSWVGVPRLDSVLREADREWSDLWGDIIVIGNCWWCCCWDAELSIERRQSIGARHFSCRPIVRQLSAGTTTMLRAVFAHFIRTNTTQHSHFILYLASI